MKVINPRDRFARALIAGVFSSVILFGLNLFSYYVLHLSERRYINYSALMIFGRKFNNLFEAILSSIAQIGFAAGLIVIFSYLILKEKRENNLWRGLFIGFGSWFSIMSFSYIIGIHEKLPINIGSAISFMVTSLIWGISGSWFLHILDERYGIQTETQLSGDKQEISKRKRYFFSTAPAYKIMSKRTVKPKKIKPKKLI